MALELECSVDYLINESMKQYARQRYAGRTCTRERRRSALVEPRIRAASRGRSGCRSLRCESRISHRRPGGAPVPPPPPARGRSLPPPPAPTGRSVRGSSGRHLSRNARARSAASSSSCSAWCPPTRAACRRRCRQAVRLRRHPRRSSPRPRLAAPVSSPPSYAGQLSVIYCR